MGATHGSNFPASEAVDTELGSLSTDEIAEGTEACSSTGRVALGVGGRGAKGQPMKPPCSKLRGDRKRDY